MKLKVLGSSSSGNCYLLTADNGETLIIEAGVRFDKVKKALDYDLSRVVGCIVTHEHGDHAGHVRDFIKAYIPTLMSGGAAEALGLEGVGTVRPVRPFSENAVGSFQVMPFPVQHDAAEPFGWLIRHDECGSVLFATDTYYLKYRFNGLSNILIECNYRIDLLRRNVEAGRIDHKRYERTIESHMSYGTCLETLLANDLSRVNNIVLIHLSACNSHASEFAGGIAKATNKQNVLVAVPGMEIDFNKTPY